MFAKPCYVSAAPMSPLMRKWLNDGKGHLIMRAILERKDTVVIDGKTYTLRSADHSDEVQK